MSEPQWRQGGAAADGLRIRAFESVYICPRTILSIVAISCLKSTVELKSLPDAPQKNSKIVKKIRNKSTRLRNPCVPSFF